MLLAGRETNLTLRINPPSIWMSRQAFTHIIFLRVNMRRLHFHAVPDNFGRQQGILSRSTLLIHLPLSYVARISQIESGLARSSSLRMKGKQS